MAASGMNAQEFDACFDRSVANVFRLETHQHYAVSEEDERFRAFREGLPRPERSVRTTPWLARIAVTTVNGRSWQRVHVVEHPLSEYLRYQLIGYAESQAAGEQIALADRDSDQRLVALDTDFWLFDAESDRPYAIVMRYDAAGHPTAFEYTGDREVLREFVAQRDLALECAVPLNVYLAGRREAQQES